jgi:hypothetical protein
MIRRNNNNNKNKNKSDNRSLLKITKHETKPYFGDYDDHNNTVRTYNNTRRFALNTTNTKLMIPMTINRNMIIRPQQFSSKEVIVKKGLLIGINYTGTDNELEGCINDSENLKKFLVDNQYFKQNELISMSDFKTGLLFPSKDNILYQLSDLVKFARTHTNKKVQLFLSYCGHGYYLKNSDGCEPEKQGEVLCPIDCHKNGYITEDDLRKYFIDKLPQNVTIIILIDSCHSKTVMDLRYSYKGDKRNTYTVIGKMSSTICDAIMLTGCSDVCSNDSYAYDSECRYEYQGAITASFIANYYDGVNSDALITNMKKWLKESGYNQVPCLSSGKYMEINKLNLLSKQNECK